MSAFAGAPEPVLVYGRIARNRHKTWMLVAFSVLALAPFVLGISYLMSAGVVWRVHTESRHTRAAIRTDRSILKRFESQTRDEFTQSIERDLEERRVHLAKLQAGDWELTLKLMPVFGVALIATMGILFWGIASSPTSKLLVQAGARPAGDAESEAKRLLENL